MDGLSGQAATPAHPLCREVIEAAMEIDGLKDDRARLNGDIGALRQDVQELVRVVSALPGKIEQRAHEIAAANRVEIAATADSLRQELHETLREQQRDTQEARRRIYGGIGAVLLTSLVAAGPNALELLGQLLKALTGG